MKFTGLALVGSLLIGDVSSFAPPTKLNNSYQSNGSSKFMAMDMDMPAAQNSKPDLPVIQSRGGAPANVRYSDFMKLVNGDRIEKVTFSSDGTQLLGVDTEGVRIKIEALPNDPDLLTSLTQHKVCVQNSCFKNDYTYETF